jgi:energy-coupling factor transport system ATP-binding protein
MAKFRFEHFGCDCKSETTSMIVLDHVSFCPPAIEGIDSPQILNDISLSVSGGEFIAIVGRNGAGKTTLIRHLNGILIPTKGRITINGMDTRIPENLASIREIVGMVFQQPEDQIIGSTVEEDTAFGLESRGTHPAEIRKRVNEVLERVGLTELRLRPPHFLSAGQMQRLALAGVLVLNPSCIIFDEVTAMLDPYGRKMVLQTMQDLHEHGTTVIFITHAMEEAVLADRLIVMFQGRIVRDDAPANILTDKPFLEQFGLEPPPAALISDHLRRFFPYLDPSIINLEALIGKIPEYQGHGMLPPVDLSDATTTGLSSEKAIEITDLNHTYLSATPLAHLALKGVNFGVYKGEAHGLIGSTGSGKSTLLQHINGLLRPQAGHVRVLDFDLNDQSIKTKTVVKKISLVFQNPDLQFFKEFVGDEVAFSLRQYPSTDSVRERVKWAMEASGLDFVTFKDRLLYTLSGGEKRKVALASALVLKPEVILLDEPTAGLDPSGRRELIGNLKNLGLQGTTYVVSSHRMEDLVAMVQNLTVLQRGSNLISGTRESVFGAVDQLRQAGLEPPTAAQAAELMRHKHWPIPADIISGTGLERFLERLIGEPHEPI